MSIYDLMEKEWQVYCIMSSIIYIEEISKPTEFIDIKKYKDKEHRYLGFHSLRLKMKDPEVVSKIFNITKKWENKKNLRFIGKSFNEVRKERFSQQDMFFLSPIWINHILNETGKIPNKYSFETAIKRINYLKQYKKIPLNKNKDSFRKLLKDKRLAAGAFIVSMDLEFRGVQSGRLSLCMSQKYEDFLVFMLKVARKWGWTHNKELSNVKIDNSLKLGIKASPQKELRIHIKGMKEIYNLAGPLANSYKDEFIRFHIKRSNNYVNLGYGLKNNKTKDKIFQAIQQNIDITTTKLQFIVGIGSDVILDHLHKLEKENKITKIRSGKRYIWNIKGK